jgi:hypothetical protein
LGPGQRWEQSAAEFLADDLHVSGRLNSQADPAGRHSHHHDVNVVVDDDSFPSFAGQDEHESLLAISRLMLAGGG